MRLKDKPFEILNISLDGSRREMESIVKGAKFPGIHTWHKKGRDNPIADLYRAYSLPTWYLIDAQGRIREKDPFGDKLVPAVERAMAAAPTGAKSVGGR